MLLNRKVNRLSSLSINCVVIFDKCANNSRVIKTLVVFSANSQRAPRISAQFHLIIVCIVEWQKKQIPSQIKSEVKKYLNANYGFWHGPHIPLPNVSKSFKFSEVFGAGTPSTSSFGLTSPNFSVWGTEAANIRWNFFEVNKCYKAVIADVESALCFSEDSEMKCWNTCCCFCLFVFKVWLECKEEY